MAILIEQEKNNSPLFITIVVVIAMAVLGLGTYFVFKSPPGIEKAIVSTEMQSVAQVSKISFDVSNVTD